MVWRQAPQGGLAVFVEIGDGDGADLDLWAVKADGGGDRSLFCADGQPVGGVLDVAAGDDRTVAE